MLYAKVTGFVLGGLILVMLSDFNPLFLWEPYRTAVNSSPRLMLALIFLVPVLAMIIHKRHTR